MFPGRIALTRIPCGPSSLAQARVNPSCAALVPQYPDARSCPRIPTIEEILIMVPFVFLRCGTENLAPAKVPIVLRSKSLCRSSTDVSSMLVAGGCQPALLMMQSSRPEFLDCFFDSHLNLFRQTDVTGEIDRPAGAFFRKLGCLGFTGPPVPVREWRPTPPLCRIPPHTRPRFLCSLR